MNDARTTVRALRRAAEYIASALRHASPSERAASAWTIETRGDTVYLRNRDLGAWGTALDKRHPTFGHDPWSNTNAKDPGRSDWDARALSWAASEAARRFGDDWIREIAANSEWEVR